MSDKPTGPEFPGSALPHPLIQLWRQLSRRRQRQCWLLFALMLVSGLAEVVSFGLILPFIAVLTAPDKVFANYPAIGHVAGALGIDTTGELMFALTVAFAVMALGAGAIRMLLLWTSTRQANAVVSDLSIEVYRRTLYQPYSMHVARNSMDVISGITARVGGVGAVMQSVLMFGMAAVLLLAITVALLAINATVAIVATLIFGIGYAATTWLFRKRLAVNSRRITSESTKVYKALQEGLGAIRDVLLDGTQSVYCDIYRRADHPLRIAQGNNIFISGCPRFVMEALGMILIALLAYSLSLGDEGLSTALPVLGALALGAQRMLPAMQQGYSAWTTISSNMILLADVLALLRSPLPPEATAPVPSALGLTRGVSFEHVRFRYGVDGPWILDGVNFTIPRGAKIGLVGSTGSGKSTALDLLMGLIDPLEGSILVDGQPIVGERRRAWQRSIAHVPQSIYLADTTLAENIAFGVPPDAIDMERVRKAAAQAHIAGFIERRKDGYGARVGERGIQLSGGQRQRIGIARALYKQASVLIFDEATSALDNATERQIISSIDEIGGDLTIVMVAHRLTTIRNCDTILELGRGSVVAQGTYEELLKISPSFRRMAEHDHASTSVADEGEPG